MITNKAVFLSNCCDAEVYYISPSLGENGKYFCRSCGSIVDLNRLHTVVVTTHVKIANGIYRPVNNM